MSTIFSDFQNLYEVRKTVRFELKPTIIKRVFHKSNDVNLEIILKDIIEKHKNFIDMLGTTFFFEEEVRINSKGEEDKQPGLSNKPFLNIMEEDKEEDKALSHESEDIKSPLSQTRGKGIRDFSGYSPQNIIRFKYQGIEKAFRNEWIKYREDIVKYRTNQQRQKIKIKNYITFSDLGDDGFLKPFFEELLQSHRELYDEMSALICTYENNHSRLSDVCFALGQLNSRKYLGALYMLFEGGYVVHKNDTEIIGKLTEQLKTLKLIIKDAISLLRPLQSFGLPIEHVSLNYYTRNKTPKEYDDEIKIKERDLQLSYRGVLGALYGIDSNQSIENLYKEMKNFKAQQKMAFMQQLQSQVSLGNFRKPFTFIDHEKESHEKFELHLFSNLSEDIYNKMKGLTKDIEGISDKEKRKELKQKRGKLLKNQLGCKQYVDFCNNYKKVAMEYGKKKAEVLSLLREKIEAEKERGRGCLSKNNEESFFINTFEPKLAKDMYNDISTMPHQTDGEITIYLLSSITLRAFNKLCFKKGSKFVKGLLGKLDVKYTKQAPYKENNTFPITLKGKKEMEEEGILIHFYNEVLRKQDSLSIKYRSDDSKDLLKNCKDSNEFEIVLKQETYMLEEKKISNDRFHELIEKYQGNSYQITSWDLRKERENPEEQTLWWRQFWSQKNIDNKYNLRINPEITISFVGKDEEFAKTHPNQSNNRKSKERYLLTTSMTHKSDKAYIDSGFIEDTARKENIINFNTVYNQDKQFDYLYGLDKGTKELVTLGVFKKGNGNIETVNLGEEVSIYKITEKGFQKNKTVTNKNGETKIRYLRDNPSLFMEYIDDNLIFEKQNIISCLGDFSSAKVIKGHIILNGDQATLKNLYLTDVKRKLYEKKSTGEMTSETIGYDQIENVFYYEYINRENVERFPFESLKTIDYLITKEEIEKELKDFLEDVAKDNISIQRINNLRNAICANIVGVIMKIQESYPGYIVREGLGDDTQHKQKKTNTYLGNLINEKIYNKLFLSIDVPPILKKFRSETNITTLEQVIQHGKVMYVNKDNTSSKCPLCNKKLFGHMTDYEYEMHHYQEGNDVDYTQGNDNKGKNGKERMDNNLKQSKKTENNNCNYHMKNNPCGFDFIKSGDDLAAYNIAKKGLEYLKSREIS